MTETIIENNEYTVKSFNEITDYLFEDRKKNITYNEDELFNEKNSRIKLDYIIHNKIYKYLKKNKVKEVISCSIDKKVSNNSESKVNITFRVITNKYSIYNFNFLNIPNFGNSKVEDICYKVLYY